jgi:ABC-type antimicrobial peptide transport system permease subunit
MKPIKKILLFALLVLSASLSASEDIPPYSGLTPEATKNLECVFSASLETSDMRTNLKDLNIKTSEDVERFVKKIENGTAINFFAKALVLDYLYQSDYAKQYYMKSYPLIRKNKSVVYDIAFFFARNQEPGKASNLLKKANSIIGNIEIYKLQAYVYLANNQKIPSNILFKCKRDGVFEDDLKRDFRNCIGVR